MRTSLFTLSSVTVCFGIVGAFAACTQDFDTFRGTVEEGGTTSGSSGTTSSSGEGGSSTPTDGSTNPTPEAGGDANVDCAPLMVMCYSQLQPCTQKCRTDEDTCEDACQDGNAGRQCRQNCEAKRDACNTQCTNACKTCGGPRCQDRCPN